MFSGERSGALHMLGGVTVILSLLIQAHVSARDFRGWLVMSGMGLPLTEFDDAPTRLFMTDKVQRFATRCATFWDLTRVAALRSRCTIVVFFFEFV